MSRGGLKTKHSFLPFFSLMGPMLAVALTGTLIPVPARADSGATFDLGARLEATPAGGTLEVPTGVYRGPLVIDRAVVIEGAEGAVIEGGGEGDVLRVEAPGVVIRGLTIQGTGKSLDRENAGVTILADSTTIERCLLRDVLFGVYLKDANGCVIRDNEIHGKDLDVARRGDAIRLWYSSGCRVERNRVVDGRDVVIWFSDDAVIRENVVTGGRYGLHFMYSDSNRIERNLLEGNSVGGFLMYSRNLVLLENVFARNRGPSGYGIGLKDMDGVEAERNFVLGNRVGIYLDNSPWSVDVHDHFHENVIAYNDIGVSFQPAVRRNIFWENSFLENLEQVAVLGSNRLRGNEFTVEGRGNFWSDYVGYDRDGDGLGDLPYRSESLFESLIDRHRKLRIFVFSPVQQAVEMASRAFPAIKPRPKVSDEAPLMSAVVPAAPTLPEGRAGSLWVLALALVGGSLGLLWVGSLRSGAAPSGRPAGLQPGGAPGGEGSGPAGPAARGAGTSSSQGVPVDGVTTSGAAPFAPVLRVGGLTKRFGRFTAVEGLDFEVLAGEAVALWGANGAGKTTAIRCVLGLVRFDGAVEVAGHDLRADGRAVRRALGYVPQELALYDDLTARESLAFYARLKGVERLRVEEVLEEVGLSEHGNKRVSALSGGMKQRLALAAALLADPPLLVLDEMTSNLDTDARRGLLDLLGKQKERGKTILFTSHRFDEVEALADRVLVLEAGRLTTEVPPARLAEGLGVTARLRLYVDEPVVERAVEALRAEGFTARPNGHGVFVRVRSDRKTEPIRLLEERSIRVRNFEVETEVPSGGKSP